MHNLTKGEVSAEAKAAVGARGIARRLLFTLGFAGLIAIGAHVKLGVPGTPVPITLQTLFVLLAGALLGPVEGTAAVGAYLVLGAAGVPVFAKAGGATGFPYFAGATGGYLVGFLAAAVFLGAAVRRFEGRWAQLVLFLAGSQMILVVGTLWLAMAIVAPLEKAIYMGFAPFVIGDVAKAVLGWAAYRWARRLV